MLMISHVHVHVYFSKQHKKARSYTIDDIVLQ